MQKGLIVHDTKRASEYVAGSGVTTSNPFRRHVPIKYVRTWESEMTSHDDWHVFGAVFLVSSSALFIYIFTWYCLLLSVLK